MDDLFSRGIAAATKLTRAGKLKEATAVLQKALGVVHPQSPGPHPAKTALEMPVLDLTAVEVPSEKASGSRTFSFSRLGKGKIPATPKVNTSQTSGEFVSSTYANEAGRRNYKLYCPVQRDGGARPLIVMLHGCTQSPDDFAAGTRMNQCAEEHECFVAYPEQTLTANPSKCWNWFKSNDQIRGRGEPAIIAGLTREIMKTHKIDPRRVFIAGLSAGGAAAAVLAEAYSDIYAAVGIHSGLACGAASDMTSAFAVMSGHASTPPAGQRPPQTFVPTIVFHGDRDTTVHPRNGAEVVARASGLSDLQSLSENATAAGRSYTRSLYRDARGRTLVEDWVIHGAGHAWSGGSSAGSFTDPKGPDASREMLRFFLAQK